MPDAGRRPILLARYLALAWCGLIVYGSLHPFAGWRNNGVRLLAFLDADWPRYWTGFDLLANVAVYLPLGFFLTLALRPWPGRYTAPSLAVLLAALLSLGMESLQNWLPSRVPSNLDLLCNTLGGLLGAAWAQWRGHHFFRQLATLEKHLLAPVPHAELGLTLLGLWLLVPLSPETLLFGAGNLRHWIDLTPLLPFSAERFAASEAVITASQTVAIGLILRSLIAHRRQAAFAIPLFIALGLGVRTLGAAVLISPQEALAWLTTGATQGLLGGLLATALLLWLPRRVAVGLAILALVAGTVLVNLTPANPYSAAALAAWRQGHFLNFNGLTRLVASLWPFLCLPFLLLSLRRP
ncbi:MAG: VanZ family protein [Dechloromonas sp.]|nr:VanZ family protein [Dechloromonas sp.]